jgi:hypothetical protein
MKSLLFAVAFLVGCSSGGVDEDIASVEQPLTHPACLTQHSPPPVHIECGRYCCAPSAAGCVLRVALSSVAQNIYSVAPVGAVCQGLVGPVNGPKLVGPGEVVK